MTDTYTLEEIEEAIDAVYVKSSTGNLTAKKVITELTRQKHSFSEGQLVIHTVNGSIVPFTVDEITPTFTDRSPKYLKGMYLQDYRPLTLTEHGQGVKDFLDEAKKLLVFRNNIPGALIPLQDAVTSFDASVSPEKTNET